MCDESVSILRSTTTRDGISSTGSLQSEAAAVPYSAPVKDLKPGSIVKITGSAQPRCARFSVNFIAGQDIAFHLNPRLNQKYIVRNARLHGRWGEEETTSIQKFSFERSKKFELEIFCSDREFLISLNGKYICAFVYRVLLLDITSIEIHGLVDVHGVDFGESQSYPATVPENVLMTTAMGAEPAIMDQQQEMEIPTTRLLPGGLQQGWQLEIHGRVKILPHSFYINLQEGYQMWPHPIVHLHLNPRFSSASGERVFVRNAYIDGHWGFEERVPLFQFLPGSPFTMAICRAADHFTVWVDGQLTGEFKFRGNVEKIDAVYIQGDITVKSMSLRESTIPTQRASTVRGLNVYNNAAWLRL